MKKMVIGLVAVAGVFCAWAYTETVGDYTWHWDWDWWSGDKEISCEYITSSKSNYSETVPCVSPSPTGAVAIPSTLDGDPVTRIGYDAFWDCDNLTSVTIPDSVTSIGYDAFSYCDNLTSVTIGNGVTNIEEYAFYDCGLTSVTIPDSVTSIGSCAFAGYYLTSISVGDNNRNFSSVNGLLLSKDGKELIHGVNGVVTIPDCVTSIGDYAFSRCSGLTSVTIPNGVTSIGNSAFYGCSGLTSVTIPNGVTSIGNSAFYGCSGLTSVTIPNSVTNIGSYAFSSCAGLTSISVSADNPNYSSANGLLLSKDGKTLIHGVNGVVAIPDGVTSIGDYAFGYCRKLTIVTIPNSVTNIGQNAFYGCSGLTTVTIPDGVTSIGNSAFYGCSGLTTVTIPDGVTSIGNSAFYGCSGLKSVTIGNGVTSIGNSAFNGCSRLTTMTIPDGVTSIGYSAFNGCSGLKSVMIGNGVTSIGNGAFNGCSGLKSVYITDLAKWCGISFGSFGSFGYGCNPLYYAHDLYLNGEKVTALTIPDNVTSIGSYAFSGCSGLTSVTIPDSVTNIGSSAFYNCSCLTSVTIPDSVTNIGSSAFYNCSGLTDVMIGNGVTNIGHRAFYECNSLTQMSIPATVQAIGDYAFEYCDKLSRVVFASPSSLTRIGEGAFLGCFSMDESAFELPESVMEIGKNALQFKFHRFISLTIDGTIDSSISLKPGVVYVISNNVTVASDATLEIRAGTILKFYTGCSLMVYGTLDAQGTRAAPIVFTSLKDDDYGGDTNDDGKSSSPQAGDWGGICILGEATLSYSRIRYGQGSYSLGSYNPGVVSVACDPFSFYYYYTWGAAPYLVSGPYYDYWNDYYGNGYYGYDGTARLTMDGCVVEHSTDDWSWSAGVGNGGGSVVARNCVFSDLPFGVYGSARYEYDEAIGGYCTMYGQTNHFVNCVFYGCDSVVMDDWYNVDSTAAVFDNCVFSEMVEWVSGYGEGIPSDLAFRNCCFWNPEDDEFYPIQTNALIGVSGNVWGNPCFESAGTGDYRIKAGSACVDAGREDVAPLRDYFGQPRDGAPDIGIHEIQLHPVNDVDLAALEISGDATATIGGKITVMWTVGNVSATNIVDEWRDVLELVDSTGHTVELGRRTVVGGLNADANLSFSARFAVPSMSPGTARLRLKVNPYRDIYEGSLTANNICLSEATVEIVLPAYDSSSNSNFTLRPGGSVALRVPAGSGTRAIRITGTGAVSAYALAGGVPAGLRYDVAAQSLTDGSLLLVLPKDAGEKDYNIAVFNEGTSETTVNMETESDTLSVREVAPSRLANTGEGHLTVLGVGMDCVSAVRLEGARTIGATTFHADNSANLSATFALSGATVGRYTVVLVDDDGETHRTDQTVEIYSPKVGPKLEAWLELPPSVRDGRTYTGWVHYRNSGDSPMDMPHFRIAQVNSTVLFGTKPNETPAEDELHLAGLSQSYPVSILEAGEENAQPFFFRVKGTYQITLDSLPATDNKNAYPEFGGSGAYRAAMAEAADRLALRGRPKSDLYELVNYALPLANGYPAAAISGILRDARTGDVLAGVALQALSVDEGDDFGVQTETDATGWFSLENLPDGDYTIRLDTGYALLSPTNSISITGQADVNGLVVLCNTGFAIAGSVLGTDGMPIVGAPVVISDEGGLVVRKTVTDETGAYSAAGLEAGVYSLFAGPSGIWTGCGETGMVISAENPFANRKITLVKGGTIAGQVTAGGKRLSEGTVEAIAADGTVRSAQCGEDGAFEIEGLAAGDYSVRYYSNSHVGNVAKVGVKEGGEAQLTITVVERPLFIPLQKIGFDKLETQFVFTDAERAGGIEKWAWDFDGDGVTDSEDPSPMWTFTNLGEHDISLTILETNGVTTTSVYPGCVSVRKALPTIYQPDAIIGGVNSGTLEILEVHDSSLVLRGEAAIPLSSEVAVLLMHDGGWIGRRVTGVRQSSGGWIVSTTDAGLGDFYRQLTYAAALPVSSVADEETLDQIPSKRLRTASASRKASGNKPVELFVKGEAKASLEFTPRLYVDVGFSIVDGEERFSRIALCGDIDLELSFSGKVSGGIKVNREVPLFKLDIPTTIPGVTIGPEVSMAFGATGSLDGELGWTGGVNMAIQIGAELIDGEWKLLEPFSATRRSDILADVSGNLEMSLKSEVGVRIAFLTASLNPKISVGPELSISAGMNSVAEAKFLYSTAIGCEFNLVDWGIFKLGTTVDLFKFNKVLFSWTAPDPEFSISSGSYKAPCAVKMRNKTNPGEIYCSTFTAYGVRSTYEPTEYAWRINGKSVSNEIEPKLGFSKPGEYKIDMRPHGRYLSGPKRAKKTITIGQPKKIVKQEPRDVGGQEYDSTPDEPFHPYAPSDSLDGYDGGIALAWADFLFGEYKFWLDWLLEIMSASGEIMFDKMSLDRKDSVDNIPVISNDPNEIVGELGVGDPKTERFVKPGQELTYTIYFENKSDAETAAQEIRVTETLDPLLDWSTFKLGEVAFNNQIDNNLSGYSSGTSEVKMNGTNYYVRTEATCDAATGKVSWYLRIVDKTTADEWPTDLHAGILPPNDETFRGEGHLTYRVKVRDDATPGSLIKASASIVFDYNDPIETNPSWTNTVAQVASVKVNGDVEGDVADLELIVGMPYGELPTPKARAGYTFGGWYTGPNGTGRRVREQDNVEAGDSGLYAYWLTNAYTVHFEPNGGEGLMSDQAFEFDKEAELDANAFKRKFYAFAGWATNETGVAVYVDGEEVENLTSVSNGVVTLYATWSYHAIEVAFDAQGGTPAPTNCLYELDAPYGEFPAVERSGFTFGGWYTGPNGTGRRVTVQAPAQADATKLYAHWLAYAYVVRYNANGGSGVMGDQAFEFDKPATLDANAFSKRNYVFAGWATTATGDAVYADCAEVVNLTTDNGGVVTLYATWTFIPQPEPTPGPTVEPTPAPAAAEAPRLWTEVTGAVPTVAALYEGYFCDGAGNVKGTIQVKVGKPGKKDGRASVSAVVVGLDGKKAKLKAAENGKAMLAADGPTTVSLAGGEACEVTLGAKGMSGTYGIYGIDGGVSVFASKDAADKSVAAATLDKWKGAVNVAWQNADTARSVIAPYQTLSVNIAAKGKAKVAGTLADGTKVSASGQLIVGENWCCVPVVCAKKGVSLQFVVWLPMNGQDARSPSATGGTPVVPVNALAARSTRVVGLEDAIVGKSGSLKSGAAFRIDATALEAVLGKAVLPYLPDGLSVTGGAKWTLPKAGSVTYAKGTTTVDAAKAGENPSGLKLTYKAKDGTFKGSFKAYSDVGGKPKATTVDVTGVLVNGVGYGAATVKKVGGVAVTVE